MRQAARHFVRYDADYYLILAGDHLYRMDYCEMVDAHVDRQRRHHDRGAAGRRRRRVGDGHLPVRSRRPDRRVRGEAERASASTRSAAAFPPGATFGGHTRRQAVRRLDGHLRVLARRAARGARAGRARPTSAARSFRRRSSRYRVQRAPVPRLLGRRRHGRVVLRREHHAHAARRAVQASTIRAGRSTRTRASCRAPG